MALTTCIKKELITMVYNYGLYNVGPPNDSVQLVNSINQLVTMGPHIIAPLSFQDYPTILCLAFRWGPFFAVTAFLLCPLLPCFRSSPDIPDIRRSVWLSLSQRKGICYVPDVNMREKLHDQIWLPQLTPTNGMYYNWKASMKQNH